MPDQNTIPKFVEGQWVQDLRPATTGRVGRITIESVRGNGWVYVEWAPRDHETVTALAELQPVRGPVGESEELDFPPPSCTFDSTSLEFDDGWYCPQCRSRWSENGTASSRGCAGCKGDDAVFIDVDGRPLCKDCTEYADRNRADEENDDA